MNLSKTFTKWAFLPIFAMVPLMLAASCAAERLYPVIVHTAAGAQMFDVEMANTPETMALGLMNRPSMPVDHGMIFLFGEEKPVSFWMKDTLIPLDMIFIRKNGEIASIHAMAKPRDETSISSGDPVSTVLEINGGEAARRGIKVGDTVETPLLGVSK